MNEFFKCADTVIVSSEKRMIELTEEDIPALKEAIAFLSTKFEKIEVKFDRIIRKAS